MQRNAVGSPGSRIKCARCRIWCGARLTQMTPRLRAAAPYASLCRQCASKRFPRKERLSPLLFRFVSSPL